MRSGVPRLGAATIGGANRGFPIWHAPCWNSGQEVVIMTMLASFGNVSPSLNWTLPSGLIELMLITLAIAAFGILAASLRSARRHDAIPAAAPKAVRILAAARHQPRGASAQPMPA
jgi:hypothetical protein